jgi:hypothetical protein
MAFIANCFDFAHFVHFAVNCMDPAKLQKSPNVHRIMGLLFGLRCVKILYSIKYLISVLLRKSDLPQKQSRFSP